MMLGIIIESEGKFKVEDAIAILFAPVLLPIFIGMMIAEKLNP